MRPHEKFQQLNSNEQLIAYIRTHWSMLEKHFGFDSVKEFLKCACWDPQHMLRIKRLCEKFDARIVVSSSWRNGRTPSQLKNLFSVWGLENYVIGKTKDGHVLDRANDIKDWLNYNKGKVERYLILDDGYVAALTQMFGDKFVHCKTSEGFTDRAYTKAVAALATQCTPIEVQKNQPLIIPAP
jgi:hypothetical protein